jgi:hypothetical protein
MSVDISSDRDAFSAFIDQRFVTGEAGVTLEEALAAFRAYQRDLERLRAKLRPAIEQADRGESRPLDLDAVMSRIRDRLHTRR